MKTTKSLIHSKIRARRQALGMSQLALALAVGVTPTAAYEWERRYAPSSRHLGKLADVLEVDVAWLLDDADCSMPDVHVAPSCAESTGKGESNG